jgi:hypothetical protein
MEVPVLYDYAQFPDFAPVSTIFVDRACSKISVTVVSTEDLGGRPTLFQGSIKASATVTKSACATVALYTYH